MLTAGDGAAFSFLGVPELLKRPVAPETALQPAHAAGAGAVLSPCHKLRCII